MIKAFNKWGVEGIVVTDLGLKDHIMLEPKMVPRTGGRHAGNRFYKSKIFIVERLINKIMIPGHKAKKHLRTSGHCTGKSNTAFKIVEEAFSIIEERTKQNPIAVFVQAVENAAPREEIITIEYGGARYPKAVECAPQRRIDIALRLMVQGTYQKCFSSKNDVAKLLAKNIIEASEKSSQSLAVSKKLEVERQADSSR